MKDQGLNSLFFRMATKTKPIYTKEVLEVIKDVSLLDKLLLRTLEGNEPLKADAMICRGEAGDVWQQSSEKIQAKYNLFPKATEEDSWLIWHPKPGNVVDAIQITKDMCRDEEHIIIQAQWGEERDGVYVQYGKVGDYLLRSQSDPTDVWIVQKQLFENTYEWKDEQNG